jgi:hypothetical protein
MWMQHAASMDQMEFSLPPLISHCLCIAFWKQIHAIASNQIMKGTKIWLIIVIVLVVISLVVVADEALSWGTFLGANWKKGEGEV